MDLIFACLNKLKKHEIKFLQATSLRGAHEVGRGAGPPWLAIVLLKMHVIIIQSNNLVIYCTGRQSRSGTGFIENVFLLASGGLEYVENKIQV